MTGDRKISSVLVLLIIFTVSCTYYKNEIYIPPVSEETSTLEAPRVESPPNKINSPYWATADYMVVNAGDICPSCQAIDSFRAVQNDFFCTMCQYRHLC